MQLIIAKYLVSMDGPPVENGGIVVENATIIDTGPTSDLQKNYPQAELEEYPRHVLMPGLINSHIHLDMGNHKNYPFDPVRSVAVDVNFVDWLVSCIDYKKNARPDNLQEAIQEGIEASIESGTTCVADMGSFEGIFPLLEKSGLRAVVFPEVMHASSAKVQDLYQSALALVEKYQEHANDRLSVGLAPYSPYTLSRQILKVLAAYCQSTHIALMTHAAESFSEMEFFYNSSGDMATQLFPLVGWKDNLPPAFQKTPIAYLEEIDFLKVKPLLVGCVQITPDDQEKIKKSGSTVVLTPRANQFLKLGEAKVAELHKKGINLALGTDSFASNATLSLWDEMRFVYEKFVGGKESGITSEDLLKMVTVNAAKALGLSTRIGTLTANKQADYLLVDLGSEFNGNDLYSHLIQNTKTYHINKVVVAGQTLKK